MDKEQFIKAFTLKAQALAEEYNGEYKAICWHLLGWLRDNLDNQPPGDSK